MIHKIAMFYIVHEDKKTAQEFVDKAISDKKVACGNVFPIESSFIWKGNVERSGEVVSIVKTTLQNAGHFQTYAERIHPYDVPCILYWETVVNKAYFEWVEENVTSL